MRKIFILCAFFMPFFVSAANTPQISDFANSSRIYKRQFSLTANTQYKFRTFSNGDSVLYLLNSNYVQVAMNDDCGSDCLSTQDSNDSTLTYTPTTTGTYHLVMRNYSSGQVGVTANLKQYINGTLGSSVSNAPLGGRKQSVPSWDAYYQTFPTLSYRKLYFYYFNTDKNASGGASAANNVLYLVSNNNIVAYDNDSGAGLTSRITKSSGSCSSGCYIFGGAYNAASEGNARLIVDPYTNSSDLDSDGLSDALEVLLGTISAPSGTIFGRDSDGDGLNDYLEAVGSGDIALPWEGSSPTQKDVFIEVDYFGRTIGGNYVNFFKDHETYIKTQLANSFDRYGDIRLHIDVDDDLGEMSDSASLKGALCKSSHFNQTNNPNWTINNFYNTYDKKSVNFTSSRDGIYYWVIAANRHTKEGETSSGISCGSTATGLGTDRVIVSLGYLEHEDNNNGTIFPATQEEYTGTTMHEMGHAFMLTHNGNDQSGKSEIHRSVMNYRYQFSGAPRNIEFSFPPYIIADSVWRYSTDNSSNRQELDWNYNNVIQGWANTGENGCLNSVAEANQSPKQACVNARPYAQPTCDCTFDEWAVLSLNSAGIMGLGYDGEDSIDPENSPIFGLNGVIVAENLDDLMNSGAKYTQMTTEAEKAEHLSRKQEIMNNYYTSERKADLREKYLKYLEERGFVEGDDYKNIDGDIVFE